MLTVLPLFSQLTTVFSVDPAEMMYKMVRDCDTVTLIALFARYAGWVSFPWNSIASFNVNGFPFLVSIYDSVSEIKDEQTNVRQSVFLRKHQIAAGLETSTPTKLSYLEGWWYRDQGDFL